MKILRSHEICLCALGLNLGIHMDCFNIFVLELAWVETEFNLICIPFNDGLPWGRQI